MNTNTGRLNTKALSIYHVFHLFIPMDGDARNVYAYSHSQGDWEILKHRQGLLWTIPTKLFNDRNFIASQEGWQDWEAKDWWQYATSFGYMPYQLLGEL